MRKPFGYSTEEKVTIKQSTLRLLKSGRQNAITGAQLAHIMGCKDDRGIRNAILELLKEGQPIASATAPPAGFFIAQTAKEVDDYRRDLRARLKKIALHSRDFRIAARQVRTPEQLSLLK